MKTKSQKMINSKENKTARGYRLKPETHKLIVKIQKLIQSDQDAAIAGACSMYFEALLKKQNK